ncbi:MAG: hypothetical protein ABI823_18470, partial [Bryobacteraceae bacterium]
MRRIIRRIILNHSMKPLALLIAAAAALAAQTTEIQALDNLEWRSLGPGSMGGRISDIEGVPGNPRIVYAAAGSAGIFKTTNGGITWKPIFDRQPTISIGAIALDPRNPQVIWAGTGEANVRNSVSIGSGVYVSRDGGATWNYTGLRDTMTISRVVVDPRDSNRVWVAAIGHPFGPNPERGVFLTQDGGKTWTNSLYTDDTHGASDLDLDPSNPDIAYAGMWRFDRKPWRYDSGDTNGGVYRTRDGGKTWTKLTTGLPTLMGRIGIKVAPSTPSIVYVVAETREGAMFRSADSGSSFTATSSARELVGRGYYFCDLRVDPADANRVYVLSDGLHLSTDGGKKFDRISNKTHGDLHALWIDPKDPQRMWQGQDGGMAFSWDRGETWEHIESISLGQFYRVYADNRQPFYYVTGGTQDNGTWIGPSRTREPSGILNGEWRMISPIVGFHALSDAADPDIVLTQTPGAGLLRTNLRTREQQMVGPDAHSYSGMTAAEMKNRFGWDAPLVRSPHGKDTIYFAGNVIFQSSNYGRNWEAISRDLTKSDPAKMTASGGPVFTDNSTSEVHGTVSSLAESPVKRGVLWAGTDDGNLQLTVNGGGLWTNVAPNLPGITGEFRVSAIEPSSHDAATAYVAVERHMLDDMQPYIFRTADNGRTWKRIDAGIPRYAFVWTVREDLKNSAVLYAGTEVGIFISFDTGATWAPMNLRNLPNVAVRDIAFQPESNDLLIATHGRGLWVLDDLTAIQQIGRGSAAATLFPIRTALRHALRATRSGGGDSEFAAPNPAYGALLTYYLRDKADSLRIEIADEKGAVIRTLAGAFLPKELGVHRIAWDLRSAAPLETSGERPGGRSGGAPRARGPQVLPGKYTVRLVTPSGSQRQTVEVHLDPESAATPDQLRKQSDAIAQI